VRLRVPTIAGARYMIETSATPRGPWMETTTVIDGNGSVLELAFTRHEAQQFFRVRLVP
jgi:hypothetical protein